METPLSDDIPAIVAALIVVASADVAEQRGLIQVDDALLTTALRIFHHIIASAMSGEQVDSSTVERVRVEAGHEVNPLIQMTRAIWRERRGDSAFVPSLH